MFIFFGGRGGGGYHMLFNLKIVSIKNMTEQEKGKTFHPTLYILF